jgi:hypothetical protein
MSTTPPIEFKFSKPEKSDGMWISHCSLGGAVVDPTKNGILNQIAAATEQEWRQWLATKSPQK